MTDKTTANTHCQRGHSYAIYAVLRKDGRRYCRECHRLRARLYNSGIPLDELDAKSPK